MFMQSDSQYIFISLIRCVWFIDFKIWRGKRTNVIHESSPITFWTVICDIQTIQNQLERIVFNNVFVFDLSLFWCMYTFSLLRIFHKSVTWWNLITNLYDRFRINRSSQEQIKSWYMVKHTWNMKHGYSVFHALSCWLFLTINLHVSVVHYWYVR